MDTLLEAIGIMLETYFGFRFQMHMLLETALGGLVGREKRADRESRDRSYAYLY